MNQSLIIDNYDSFVYNIAQYLGELGVEWLVSNGIISIK
jgi:anthranilate/para-aminobenzoate synthase component II